MERKKCDPLGKNGRLLNRVLRESPGLSKSWKAPSAPATRTRHGFARTLNVEGVKN